jgi:hypothetical protein
MESQYVFVDKINVFGAYCDAVSEPIVRKLPALGRFAVDSCFDIVVSFVADDSRIEDHIIGETEVFELVVQDDFDSGKLLVAFCFVGVVDSDGEVEGGDIAFDGLFGDSLDSDGLFGGFLDFQNKTAEQI